MHRNFSLHTSRVHVSSELNVTIGLPPDSSSIRFWGRNRATTLMLLAADMAAIVCPKLVLFHQCAAKLLTLWSVVQGVGSRCRHPRLALRLSRAAPKPGCRCETGSGCRYKRGESARILAEPAGSKKGGRPIVEVARQSLQAEGLGGMLTRCHGRVEGRLACIYVTGRPVYSGQSHRTGAVDQ